MRNIDIDQTFNSIRQLPAEVDYKTIEQLVRSRPSHHMRSGNPLNRWMNFSLFLIILLLGTATTIALVFNRNKPEKKLSTPVAADQISQKNTEKEAIPQKNTPVSSPDNALATPAQRKQAIQNEQHETPNIPATIPPVFKEETEPQPEEVAADQLNTAIAEDTAEEEDYLPLRVRTYTSSFCNFEGEDAWINAFVRALIKEKIIIDTLNLHFTISRNFFEVNGKKQAAIAVTRYNELYTSITQVVLNNKSRISLSVGESSCSLSKTIEE